MGSAAGKNSVQGRQIESKCERDEVFSRLVMARGEGNSDYINDVLSSQCYRNIPCLPIRAQHGHASG